MNTRKTIDTVRREADRFARGQNDGALSGILRALAAPAHCDADYRHVPRFLNTNNVDLLGELYLS